jgi:hypothetical protein
VDKLTTADKVIFASAIVFLISLFLPWYGITEGGIDFNSKGTDYFLTGWLPLLLAIVMVRPDRHHPLLAGHEAPRPAVPWGQIHMIAGIACACSLVLRLASCPTTSPASVTPASTSTEVRPDPGPWLAAIGLAVGGFLKNQEGETDTAVAVRARHAVLITAVSGAPPSRRGTVAFSPERGRRSRCCRHPGRLKAG